MLSQSSQAADLEFAHILFMDIVGYSLLKSDEQPRILEELYDLLRGTTEYRRAEMSGDLTNGALLCVPTGDGTVMVFFRSPIAPVRCAMEISRALFIHPSFKLRMGLHSGMISRMPDFTGRPNAFGEGINMAQRVMDCGDAGHILLSSKIAEMLFHSQEWNTCIQPVGDVSVKHGISLRLYNLCSNAFGNPNIPSALTRAVVRDRDPNARPPAAPSPDTPPPSCWPAHHASTPLLWKRARTQTSVQPAQKAAAAKCRHHRPAPQRQNLFASLSQKCHDRA